MNFGDQRLPDRFWDKVIPEPNSGCWLWTGASARGYGYIQIKLGRRRYKATLSHRHAYQTLVAPIGDGLDVDHLCRNTACCNPAHLEPVTHEENMRRSPLGFQNQATQQMLARRRGAKERAATCCKRGHEFTVDNTRVDTLGRRACRSCIAINEKKRASA